jgi:hypothetical protein
MFQEVCYGLDDPGIEPWLGARFSVPVQTRPGAYPTAYTLGTVSCPGVKRPERGVNHPPLANTNVKERIKLYMYSLCAVTF